MYIIYLVLIVIFIFFLFIGISAASRVILVRRLNKSITDNYEAVQKFNKSAYTEARDQIDNCTEEYCKRIGRDPIKHREEKLNNLSIWEANLEEEKNVNCKYLRCMEKYHLNYKKTLEAMFIYNRYLEAAVFIARYNQVLNLMPFGDLDDFDKILEDMKNHEIVKQECVVKIDKMLSE